MSSQLYVFPHKICQSSVSLALFHPCQKAYRVRGPLAPNNAERPSGVRYRKRGCSIDVQVGRGEVQSLREGPEPAGCLSVRRGRTSDPKKQTFWLKVSFVVMQALDNL